MKKTLIAAAVAAAIAAPAANAGVQIYGTIHMSIDYLDQSLSEDGTVSGGVWEVNSRTSKLGFKGSEDLGNGLKAIWKVENTLRITDTASNDSHRGSNGHWGSARNAYIGLAGDWGTFLYGRHDTPYKMAWYSTGIDMLGDSLIDANALYSVVEVRADDAIAYVSPNWNGLTLAGAIVPGESYDDGTQVFDGFADNWSIGAMYSNNGLKLAAGYEVLDQGLPSSLGWLDDCGSGCTNTMVGAGYTMNAFDMALTWTSTEIDSASVDSIVFAAAYTFGNNKLIANVGQVDVSDVDPTIDGDEMGYGVALQHMFSKRTSAYLAYTNSAGRLNYTSSDVAGVFSDWGEDAEGVSFGMIHKF
jgi:predicted porin